MTRRILTVFAALTLVVSAEAGCSRKKTGVTAQETIAPATSQAEPVAPTAAHNLDFGKLPDGWEASRNPNGEPRGITNIVDNEAARARIVIEAADIGDKSVEDVAKALVTDLKGAGHKATAAAKDKDGEWSIEVVIVEDGVAAGKGFCIIRTFKSDPGAAYLFQGMWPNASDSLPAVKEARAISKGATLK